MHSPPTAPPVPSPGGVLARIESSPRAGWLLVFLASLAVYAATANRGPQWQDSGTFILAVVTDQPVNPLGLALSHPLHHRLARLAVAIDRLEPAWAVTLVSALGAALAVANVFGCLRYLTGHAAAAFFGALSLAVAHTFWRLATVAEVYTLSAALLAGECWCLAAFLRGRRRAIWGAWLLNGLHLANHLSALLTTPILAVVTLLALRRRRAAPADAFVGFLLWCVGSLPYTALVAAEAGAAGDWTGTLRSALLGEGGLYRSNVLNLHLSMRLLAVSAGFTILSFPNLLLPAAVAGILRPARAGVEPAVARALLAGLILHAAFAGRYNVVDQHTFFLPTYVLLALFGGIGAAGVLAAPAGRRRRRLAAAAAFLLAATPVFYAVAPAVARHFRVLRSVERHKPCRDDYVYLFTPWAAADRSAAVMSAEAVRLASPGGLILVEDPMAAPAIQYRALRAALPDLEVAPLPRPRSPGDPRRDEALAAALRDVAAGRPVVLVPARTDRPPAEGCKWYKEGDLFVLAGPASRPSRPVTDSTAAR